MDKQILHERILYPVVRVRTKKAAGSGTLIYSKPDPRHEGDHQTFVLTNWHVIEAAIATKDKWNSLLKREIKTEILDPVAVDIFDYVRMSTVNSSNSHRAEIVAYDQNHDLAVLRLDSPKAYPYIATLMGPEEADGFRLFTPIWTSGCSLAHDPFANPGYVTYLNETIESKLYWMTNANAIFGNSGGGVFCGETGQQIGVTARVTGIQVGFGVDIMTWMSFFIPAPRIHGFVMEQELRFLYDEEDTYYEAMKRREEKEREGLLSMFGEKEKGYSLGLNPDLAPKK